MHFSIALLAVSLLLTGCGPCGVGGELLDGPFLFMAGLATILGIFGYYVVRDGFRFGRDGMSWFIGAIGSGIFSGAGFFFAGRIGVVAGVPFLVAFGVGRYRRRCGNQNPST
jgi:hypothetical protein